MLIYAAFVNVARLTDAFCAAFDLTPSFKGFPAYQAMLRPKGPHELHFLDSIKLADRSFYETPSQFLTSKYITLALDVEDVGGPSSGQTGLSFR